MTAPLPRIHAVTDGAVLELVDLAARARSLAKADGVALHARSSLIGGRRLTELAVTFKGTGAPVFVNDRADVATIVGARGVHLPAKGLPIAAVRGIVGGELLIGRSTHSADEARRAADQGADYVCLGPIWETASHPGRRPLGPHVIADARSIPVIAIGGVTPGRTRLCIEAGAYGVAAVSALWHDPDPGAVAREMLLCLGG